MLPVQQSSAEGLMWGFDDWGTSWIRFMLLMEASELRAIWKTKKASSHLPRAGNRNHQWRPSSYHKNTLGPDWPLFNRIDPWQNNSCIVLRFEEPSNVFRNVIPFLSSSNLKAVGAPGHFTCSIYVMDYSTPETLEETFPPQYYISWPLISAPDLYLSDSWVPCFPASCAGS